MRSITETKLAYTAGLIDADGCITLNKKGGNTVWRAPMVAVDNTDRELINYLQETHGGSVVKKKKYKEHHRQAWTWRLYGADIIISFLHKILPYLRCKVKRTRALLLTESYKVLTPRNGHYTPEMAAEKQKFEETFMATGKGRGWRSWGEIVGEHPNWLRTLS